MIFLQDHNGSPLMPTERASYIRRLLKRGEAKVCQRIPFTVKLLHITPDIPATQPLILGIDPGSTIGVAVITATGRPVLLAEVVTRSHTIPDLMRERAAARRARRQARRAKRQRRAIAQGTCFEGTREYRLSGHDPKTEEPLGAIPCKHIKPKRARINNRKNKEACYRLTDDTLARLHNDGDVPADVLERLAPIKLQKFGRQNEFLAALTAHIGAATVKTYKRAFVSLTYADWIAPTVQHFFDTHKQIIQQILKLLPISKIVLEYAAFDIQKMQHPDIAGEDYQRGPLFGFGYENVKQYVLERDGHHCQHCQKRTATKLHIHHLVWRRNGGADTHDNLITLCRACHDAVHTNPAEHAKLVKKFGGKRKPYPKTTMLNIIMPRLEEWLRTLDIPYRRTFGYLTKWQRKQANLEKRHTLDAYIIARGSQDAVSGVDTFPVFQVIQERRHNRQLITRVEDRKYSMTTENGKDQTIAHNRNRREGQQNIPGLQELLPTLTETQISQLRVRPAIKAKSSKFKGINKGDLVRHDGKAKVVRGYASYGKTVYLHGEGKKPFSSKKVARIKRNSGLVWMQASPIIS